MGDGEWKNSTLMHFGTGIVRYGIALVAFANQFQNCHWTPVAHWQKITEV